MRNLLVVDINSTTLNISFTAPSTPNGIIDYYDIDIENALDMPPNFTDTVDYTNTTEQFFITVSGLGECSLGLLMFICI